MTAYSWPGNVRELRNVVESHLLIADDLEVWLDELIAGSSSEPISTAAEQIPVLPTEGLSLDTAEQAAIMQAVRVCNGNLTAAAHLLGVSRSTLYRKMGRY